MPSGLTCRIYSGEDLSLRGFALKCITHFGAGYVASRQGDIELPKDKPPIIEVDDYYNEQIEEATKKLVRWNSLKDNLDEAKELYNKQKAEREKYVKEENKRREELKERYLTVLKKTESWEVPSDYDPIKQLMLKQLHDSIKWDCAPYVSYDNFNLSIEEWVEDNIKETLSDIKYYTRRLIEEKNRTVENNQYLKGFYEALDRIEPLEK